MFITVFIFNNYILVNKRGYLCHVYLCQGYLCHVYLCQGYLC
jgi:hypothetical protein